MDIKKLLKEHGLKSKQFKCKLKPNLEIEAFLKELQQAYKDTKESCSEKFKG